MQSIVLISSDSYLLVKLRIQWENKAISILENKEQLNIETKEGRIYLNLSNDIIADYDDKELNFLKKHLPDEKHFFSLCYSNKIILNKFLNSSAFDDIVYIDDDNGNILTLEEFITKKS